MGKPVYVCRLCCLAYESRAVQMEHVKTHGVFRSCLDCSMLCFTDQQMAQHQQAHAEKNKIIFGCSICLIAFETVRLSFFYLTLTFVSQEERLHQHNRSHHQQPPIYFCKLCGYGCTENTIVVKHVIHERACSTVNFLFLLNIIHVFCVQNASHFPGKAIQKIGMCSTAKLHYQPTDVEKYGRDVADRKVETAQPAECVHRSFLTTNEAVITCDQCFSLVSYRKFSKITPFSPCWRSLESGLEKLFSMCF